MNKITVDMAKEEKMETPINKIYTVGGSDVAFLTYDEAKRFVELHSNKHSLYDIWSWKVTNKTLSIAKMLLANGKKYNIINIQ